MLPMRVISERRPATPMHLTLLLKRMRALQHLPRVPPAPSEVTIAVGISPHHMVSPDGRSFTSAHVRTRPRLHIWLQVGDRYNAIIDGPYLVSSSTIAESLSAVGRASRPYHLYAHCVAC